MAVVGVLGNVFLAVFKLVAGVIGHSTAMLSDSVHTLSDVFATLIAFIGVLLSKGLRFVSCNKIFADRSIFIIGTQRR